MLFKFFSVKRDVNFSTRKSVDVHFQLLAKDMTNFEEKGKETTELTFANGN